MRKAVHGCPQTDGERQREGMRILPYLLGLSLLLGAPLNAQAGPRSAAPARASQAPREVDGEPGGPASKPALSPVGTAILRLPNPTKEGAKKLSFFLVYPATKRGKHSPFAKGVWRRPALVFLHGLGGTGSGGEGIARYLARRGYLVFLLDGSRLNPEEQFRNAKAAYQALVAQGAKKGSLLFGRLDPKRIALGGHSMGGGTTLRVLAENPGYRAGVLVAPWNGINAFSPQDPSPRVKVPTLVIAGDADRLLSWKKYAAKIFNALGVPKGEALFALLKGTGHLKVIFPRRFPFYGYDAEGPAARTTFPLVAAFLDKVLRGRGTELARFLKGEKTLPHLRELKLKG